MNSGRMCLMHFWILVPIKNSTRSSQLILQLTSLQLIPLLLRGTPQNSYVKFGNRRNWLTERTIHVSERPGTHGENFSSIAVDFWMHGMSPCIWSESEQRIHRRCSLDDIPQQTTGYNKRKSDLVNAIRDFGNQSWREVVVKLTHELDERKVWFFESKEVHRGNCIQQ